MEAAPNAGLGDGEAPKAGAAPNAFVGAPNAEEPELPNGEALGAAVLACAPKAGGGLVPYDAIVAGDENADVLLVAPNAGGAVEPKTG